MNKASFSTAIVLCLSGIAAAQTIGDFAPLAIGNEWIYDVKSEHKNNGFSEQSTGTHTVTVSGSRESDDTVWYYIEHRVSLNVTTVSDTQKGTDALLKQYSDTLFETNGIIQNRSMSHVFPVRCTHNLDTASSGIDSIEYRDGAWEFTSENNGGLMNVVMAGPPRAYTTTFRFREGVGITHATTFSGMHMQTVSSESTLRSFNGNHQKSTPVTIMPQKLTVREQDRCHTSVALPHIGIMKNGRTYNLLGRVYTEREVKNLRKRKWHQQVVELFR